MGATLTEMEVRVTTGEGEQFFFVYLKDKWSHIPLFLGSLGENECSLSQ